MVENDNAGYQIIMNMLVKQKDKDYLIIIASNTSRDFAIILVQESSNVYCSSKYVLNDFRKINFFKKYFENLRQCIETMIDLLKQKKHLINIEEEENQLKLSLDIELSVADINLNLPKERIEFILEKDDNANQKIKNNIIWYSVLYLFQEKEEDQKILKSLENKINQLNEEINDLKGSLEEKKLIPYFRENRNDLNQSKIINVHNKKSFELVERRLRILNNNNNEINFKLLYSAKINGDKSQKFHELCDNHRNTLVIIKTQSDNIFGGFAGKTWNSMELGRKKDLRSFLFSLKNNRIYNPKKDSKYHLFCSDNEGPCFYAFSIDNQCLENGGFCDEVNKCSYDSFEYDFELNNREKQFKVDKLEVYEVKFI